MGTNRKFEFGVNVFEPHEAIVRALKRATCRKELVCLGNLIAELEIESWVTCDEIQEAWEKTIEKTRADRLKNLSTKVNRSIRFQRERDRDESMQAWPARRSF